MINVAFYRKNGYIVSFSIKGHANYDEYGKDIVCSAVSTAAQLTIIGVTEVLEFPAKYKTLDGDIHLNIDMLSLEEIITCQYFMETMFRFIKGLKEAYGKYVKVKIEEV